MNTHIVRVNEKIEQIAILYNLTTDEIIKINQHIKDWQHLIPGTKIRLPKIPEIVQTELDNTEPFIEEYYPKITEEDLQHLQEENYITNYSIQSTPEKNIPTHKNIQQLNYNNYYPQYGYYNSKYYNEYIRKKKTKGKK